MKIKNRQILLNILSITLIVFAVMPFLVSASTTGGGGPAPTPGGGGPAPTTGGGGPAPTTRGSSSGPIVIPNPFKHNSISGLIATIIDEILIPVGGVLSVLMIIYAGFMFVMARGNDTKLTSAKQALLWACVGAAILLGAKIISTVIENTINQLK